MTSRGEFVAPVLAMFVLTVLAIEAPLLAAGRPVGFTAARRDNAGRNVLRVEPPASAGHRLGPHARSFQGRVGTVGRALAGCRARRSSPLISAVMAALRASAGRCAPWPGMSGLRSTGWRHALTFGQGPWRRRRVARRHLAAHRGRRAGHRSRGCLVLPSLDYRGFDSTPRP